MKKILGIATLLVLGLSLAACTSKVELKLKKESVDIEYGNQIDSHVATYLDNDEDILKDVKLSGMPENEKDRDYPATGEYTLTLAYKDDSDNAKEVKISVKDTTPPKFEDVKDKYEVDYGKKLSTDDFKATDLSKVTVTLEDKDVNYKKAGTYKAIVIAKDESNNETKKDIEVAVKEEEKKETTSTSSSSSSNKTSSSGNNTSSSTKKSTSSASSSSSSKSSNSSSNFSSSNSSNTSTSVDPATCNHRGIQPYIGGWFNDDVEMQKWFAEYSHTHEVSTYGATQCDDCGKWCIHSVN